MKKEIAPEQYNYNKFPGPEFITFDQFVKSDDISFTILENHKEALDVTAFTQRFSEIMLRYDYIVGDWSNGQLRLKGFFKDEKPVLAAQKVSRIEDYLKEYCSFGCAYFILENAEPRELPKEEDKPRRRRNRRQNNRSERPERDKKDNRQWRQQASETELEVHFEPIKKPRRSKPKNDFKKIQRKQTDSAAVNKKKPTKQKAEKVQQHFTIRKKEN
ncbi:YutD family protein [Streptococcus caprae]|uniref:YutD family protein n=1 Tax=Streptococcus caprae TaxID=1640501 RepID=A0ABV8CWQ4_9STRE